MQPKSSGAASLQLSERYFRQTMISIRDAHAGDAATIAEFNRLLAWESESKRLDADTLAAGVARALATPALCRYFLAEVGGQPVGQTMLTYELTDWRDGVLWWIQSVYVVESERGKGVFRALFEHIEGLAKGASEVRGLRLYVEEHNARALATYRQMGMRPSGHLLFELDWSGAIS